MKTAERLMFWCRTGHRLGCHCDTPSPGCYRGRSSGQPRRRSGNRQPHWPDILARRRRKVAHLFQRLSVLLLRGNWAIFVNHIPENSRRETELETVGIKDPISSRAPPPMSPLAEAWEVTAAAQCSVGGTAYTGRSVLEHWSSVFIGGVPGVIIAQLPGVRSRREVMLTPRLANSLGGTAANHQCQRPAFEMFASRPYRPMALLQPICNVMLKSWYNIYLTNPV